MRHRGSFVVWAALLGSLAIPSAAVAADRLPWQTRAAARLEKATEVPLLGRVVLPLAARLSVAGLRASSKQVNAAYKSAYHDDGQHPELPMIRAWTHGTNVGLWAGALWGIGIFRPLLELSPVQATALWAAPFVLGAGVAALIERGIHGWAEKAGNQAALAKAATLPTLAASTRRASALVTRANLLPSE